MTSHARVTIPKYDTLKLREQESVARLTKSVLGATEGSFAKTPDEMISRVLRDLEA